MDISVIPEPCNKFLKKAEKYFEVKLKRKPSLIKVKTRKEFNLITGRKTKKWMVATPLKGNIVIFSEETIEKETTHKKEEYIQLINHEISHLCYYEKYKENTPVWLNEGLALHLAGQKKKSVKVNKEDMLKLYTIEGFLKDKQAYQKSYELVRRIIKK